MVKKNFLMTAPLLMASFCSAQEKPNVYNPQIEMFAHFKTKSSFHKTKGII